MRQKMMRTTTTMITAVRRAPGNPQMTGWVSLISHSRASFLPCRSSSAPITSRHVLWYSFSQSRCRREEGSHRCTCLRKSPIKTRRDALKIVTSRRLIYIFNSYLLLGEQCCVYHFYLNRNQSQGLKRQATPVPVVVLKKNNKKIHFPEWSWLQVTRPSLGGSQSSRDFSPTGSSVKQFSAW